MPIEIIIPRLGWSMEQGAFVAWLKKDGDFVQPGEPIFSIEGDKAVQEIEAIDGGILRILPGGPQAGSPVRVGDRLGYLLTKEEFAGWGTSNASRSETLHAEPIATPVVPKEQQDPEPLSAEAKSGNKARSLISPRALRVARELGLEWQKVRGTGRGGRIREADIRRLAEERRPAEPADPEKLDRPPENARETLQRYHAVFFGELLMRLTTIGHERFAQARGFDVRYTGAEANAAVSLANFGLEASVVSAVPDNEIGQACLNYLRQYGVITDPVLRREGRLGTFYLEIGAPPRPSQVIYDRESSCFSRLRPGDIDWDNIFRGKQWFHWSGTAPAIGFSIPAVIQESSRAAIRMGLKVSCDLNYRSKLWSVASARSLMGNLMESVDVLIGSEEHLSMILGDPVGGAESGTSRDRLVNLMERVRSKFQFSEIAVTVRASRADRETFAAVLSTAAGNYWSRDYEVASVDRVGAGDAFSGALIYALLSGMVPQQAIEFAAAAGCLKHSMPGDFNLASRAEVLALVEGQTGRRVLR